MSLVIKFYFTSSMLNMFRTLRHPSSGACDFSIVSPHRSCVLASMCVWSFGVAGLGWYPCSRLQLVIMFYFTSSVLNMFRTLRHPSSGACDFCIVSPHWSCVLASMFVGSFGVAGLGYQCSWLQPATPTRLYRPVDLATR
jgi:hypothetical protein